MVFSAWLPSSTVGQRWGDCTEQPLDSAKQRWTGGAGLTRAGYDSPGERGIPRDA